MFRTLVHHILEVKTKSLNKTDKVWARKTSKKIERRVDDSSNVVTGSTDDSRSVLQVQDPSVFLFPTSRFNRRGLRIMKTLFKRGLEGRRVL